MNSTNDLSESISQSILQSSEPSMPSLSSNDTGYFDSLKNINTTTWILIILILAFLGFNIFSYLEKGTQTVIDIFAPLIKKIFGITLYVTDDVIDVSAEGAKAVVSGTAKGVNAVVSGTAGAISSGLTAVQDVTPNGAVAPSTVKGEPINQSKLDIAQQSTLNKALNTAQSQPSQQQEYQANEASSSVHSSGKSGWCFIGEDRGFNTCAQVGVNDQCMSGDIFPSQEICMNPTLRA